MKTLHQKYKKVRKTVKKQGLKKVLLKILKSNTTPHQIAFGAAIGILFSFVPTFTLGMFFALFLAWKYNFNFLSTYLGSLVVNPINSSLIYFINYQVGSILTGRQYPVHLPITLSDIKYIFAQIYIGGFFISIILAVSAYVIIFFVAFNVKKVSLKYKLFKVK